MCFQVVDAMYIFPCTSKISSDAILIFSNSSLMQSRYKVDTFHAVFALEILAPCISVFSMHNELQLHAFQCIHIEFQFHAFQCMHIEFQFHAFQYMHIEFQFHTCTSNSGSMLFSTCTSNSSSMHFSAMNIKFQFHAFQCYAHWIPVPCTLHECIFSMHVEFETHAAHQISFLCMFHAF